MRHFIFLLMAFFMTQSIHGQILNHDTHADSTQLQLHDDSIRFYQLLDTIKNTGEIDSVQYLDLRLAGIIYMHKLDDKQAYPFLKLAYQFNKTDTVTNRLLYEALIMKINKQKKPTVNIKDITQFRKDYIFLKDSVLLQEIFFRDAVLLLTESFEKDDLKVINTYYDMAIKELQSTKIKTPLLNIANTEIMFYNVALRNYLAKNSTKAAQILKLGSAYFPNNKDMQELKKHMDKRK